MKSWKKSHRERRSMRRRRERESWVQIGVLPWPYASVRNEPFMFADIEFTREQLLERVTKAMERCNHA